MLGVLIISVNYTVKPNFGRFWRLCFLCVCQNHRDRHKGGACPRGRNMLLLNGDRVNTIRQALDSTALAEGNEQFTRTALRHVTDQSSVCVLQREVAAVRGGAGITLGTCDATTCLAMIIVPASSSTNLFVVSHLDEDTVNERALRGMFAQSNSTSCKAYVLGAYNDEYGTSRRILRRFLGVAIRLSDLVVDLQLFYVQDSNTVQKVAAVGERTAVVNAPRYTGLGIDSSSGLVFPAEFVHRGPCVPERMGQGWVRGYQTGESEHGHNDHQLYNIFDTDAFCYKLPSLNVEFDDNFAAHLEWLLSLSDNALLLQTSTSPFAEPTRFCDDTRAAITWLLEHRDLKRKECVTFEMCTLQQWNRREHGCS